MTPEQLLQLVLDATNTNDYDDSALGWLSTALYTDRNELEITFRHDDGSESTALWKLVRL